MNGGENNTLSHSWLTNTVQEKCRESNLGKLVSIAIEPMDLKGDGLTSDLQRVKMVFNNETGSKLHSINLVAKMNKPVEHESETDENLWSNRTEVEMYLIALRQMEELMQEFDDQRDTLWPSMYGHVPYSVLLLEDLGQRYKMIPRQIWLDEEHTLLVLRSLAKYHAMSKILIERGRLGHYESNYICGTENPFHKLVFTGSLELLVEAMIKRLGSWESVESSESWGKRLELLVPTIYEKRVKIYKNYDKRFEVLNHGDFRSANMMFKTMEYTGRPTNVKFFDFQVPHINSFAWDLVYFLGVSVQPSLRRERRSELLKAYQQSLADNLIFFNYEGYVPTLDDVECEIDRLALVEFSHMVGTTPIVISSLDNALVLDKIMTHPPEESMNKLIFTEERYVHGIIGDFERFMNLKVF